MPYSIVVFTSRSAQGGPRGQIVVLSADEDNCITGGYSAEILCSYADFHRFSQDAGYLFAGKPSTSDPRFFCASVDEALWIPLILVVSLGGSTVGLVYAKERKLARIPTGLIYADATLEAMVVADPVHRKAVLDTALHQLLNRRRTLGLRVVVSPEGFEHRVIKDVLDSERVDIHQTAVENHCVLDLGSDYEEFLSKLGKKTRRNFRYYRRRFEEFGVYVDQVAPAEFERVAYKLLEKSVVGAAGNGVERALKILAAVKNPLMAGLRHQNGELVSIVGGWYESDRAVMFFQMNDDRDFASSALSTVLRGYLIEDLIARNIPHLLFWAGIGSPLLRHCWFVPAACIHLDVPTFGWRTVRRLASWASNFLPLPSRNRVFLRWVSGDDGLAEGASASDSRFV